MSKQIKIVHIITGLNIGGAQVLLLDILTVLKKHEDLENTVISFRFENLVNEIEENKIRVINLNKKGLFNITIFFKVLKLLKKIRPDIVHTHLLTADFYGRLAAKFANVPLILSTCHNYASNHRRPNANKKFITDYLDNFVVSFTNSRIIAISDFVKNYILKRKKNIESKVKRIYNGINPLKSVDLLKKENRAEFRNILNIDEKDFLISIIGRLDPQKGHIYFIDTLKEFIKEKGNIKILILGNGSLKSKIEDFINLNNLENYVFVMPARNDIQKIYEISDLIAVPSLWEAFGLVVVEGMIKRKVVLASNVGAIPEIIKDGVNGFLFENENRESLLGKFSYIYENTGDMTEIKSNAHETVMEKFNIEKNAEEIYKTYLEWLDEK